ncbi:MAG: hypothetical protein HY558_06445 [Euryarchaeota archaeon]|nr:hypothetical protein [Euryarchaeota archaeon]
MPGRGGPPAPGSPGALDRLCHLRRHGKAAPGDLYLLFNALEELAVPRGPLAWEVSHAPDLHVAFALPDGKPLTCVQVRGGKLSHHTDPELAAAQVALPPAAAQRALTRHPAGALIEAYLTGEAKVEGEVPQFMSLISLLEGLACHLEPAGGEKK